ncbi:MAG: hypothetical protein ACP5O2_09500 [Bacteroidales bacterium]
MNTERLLQEITEQADQVIKEREELRNTTQRLQNDLESCKRELGLTLDKLRNREEEIFHKQASIEKLQAQMLERELDINRLRQEKTELNKSLESANLKIQDLERQIQAIHAEKETLSQQVADLQKKFLALREKSQKARPARKKGNNGKGVEGSAEV